jgi:hypothetical protein
LLYRQEKLNKARRKLAKAIGMSIKGYVALDFHATSGLIKMFISTTVRASTIKNCYQDLSIKSILILAVYQLVESFNIGANLL